MVEGVHKKCNAFGAIIKIVSLLAILLPVIFAFLYVHRFGVNVVYHDQWSEFPLFGQLFSGRLGFSDLFSLHNEHRIFFPRIVMLLLGVATAYNTVAEMYFIQVCTVATLVILWLAFRRPSGQSNRYELLLFVPIAFLLFSLRQHSSTLQGIQIVVALAQTFAVLSFYCLYVCRLDRFRKFAFPVALASGTIASFSFLQGLFVWPVGFLQLLITPMQKSVKRTLAVVWALIGAAEWVLYFFDFSNPGGRSLSYVLSVPVVAAKYFLTLAGGTLFWRLDYALLGGAFVLALAAIALFLIYSGDRLGDYSFWIAVLSFVALFMLAATVGRVEFGVPQAIASRYVNFTILLPISVYAIFAKLTLERGGLVVAGFLVAISALILVSLPTSYERGIQEGISTRESREMDALILSNYKSEPGEILATLVPQLNAVEEGKFPLSKIVSRTKKRAALLDRLDYNVFAGPQERSELPPLSELSPLNSSTLANVDRIERVRVKGPDKTVAVPPGEVVVDVTGWAVDAEAEKPAGGVYVRMNGRLFPAFYGLKQGGVAQQFGVPAYSRSGFEAAVSVLGAGPGTHELDLFVLSHDRKSYYRVPGAATIRVRGG